MADYHRLWPVSSALQFIGVHAAIWLPKAAILWRIGGVDGVIESIRLRPEAQDVCDLACLLVSQRIFAQSILVRLEARDSLYLLQHARRDDQAALHPFGSEIIRNNAVDHFMAPQSAPDRVGRPVFHPRGQIRPGVCGLSYHTPRP